MKTSSCKAKGRTFQQWVAKKISEVTCIPFGKDELIASREMGQSGTDIRLIGDAKKLFPYSVECKNQETWSVVKWIEQAKSNQEKNTDWVLFIKKNRHEPVVVIDAEHFFKLILTILKK